MCVLQIPNSTKNLNSTCKDKKCAVDVNDYLVFNFIKGITETEDESLAVNDGVLFECHLWKCNGFLNREIDDGELLAAVKIFKNKQQVFLTECWTNILFVLPLLYFYQCTKSCSIILLFLIVVLFQTGSLLKL